MLNVLEAPYWKHKTYYLLKHTFEIFYCNSSRIFIIIYSSKLLYPKILIRFHLTHNLVFSVPAEYGVPTSDWITWYLNFLSNLKSSSIIHDSCKIFWRYFNFHETFDSRFFHFINCVNNFRNIEFTGIYFIFSISKIQNITS